MEVCQASDGIEIPIGFETTPRKEGSLLPYHTVSRPRIALALSGGGARGLAHIGVLQVLESNGIPIDGIAGTSMGAVVGGLYSTGYTALELEQIALRINWSDLIQDRPPRRQMFLSQKAQSARSLFEMRFQDWSPVIRSSITGGHKLNTLLTDLIYKAPQSIHSDFDQLKIPLRIVATDLLTGQKIILSSGSMVDAMRGSMAIPLMFTPVSYPPWYLADGGLVQNLPVEEARIFEPDLVLAVDTSSKLRLKSDMKAPWQMADQVTTIMHKYILDSQLESADLIIQPALNEVSNTDFSQIQRIIRDGRLAAEDKINEIETRILNLGNSRNNNIYTISSLKFSGLEQISADLIRDLVHLDFRNPISQQEVMWAGHMIYQSGNFQKISASLDTVSDILTFRCVENPTVDQIEITGNTQFSDEEILSLLNWTPGSIMNHSYARGCYSAFLNLYKDKGYSLFQILDTKVTDRKMTISIDEGRIKTIEFQGNHRTRPSIIERDLSLKSGDLFNIQKMTASLDNLYSTGLYDDIRFDIREETQDKSLLLTFIEKPYHLIRFGLRYDLKRQTKGFMELVEENVFGLGGQGSLTALYGSWDKMAQLQIRSDRLFNSLWTAEAHGGFEERRYRYYEDYKQTSIYTISRAFASLAVGQQMQKLGTLWAQLNTEKYKTSLYEGVSAPIENNVLTTISLRSIVDTRDEMPFPNSGKYYVLEYQSSLSFLGSQVPYFRLFSSMSSFYSLTNRLVFMPRLRWGTADLTIPFIKQFRLGGLDSFCGLPEYGAVGKRFIAMNTMLRYQIPWIPLFRQYISMRYDLGGVWEHYSKITLSDFIHGAGLIWSAKTPVGPAHIGWGRLSTGHSQWYLSLGYQF
ncbi:patatin-like phospholipase family protein [candidate division KSB1 bacterium]|nr:patatin-like phospholipase family protein [candidate division KSB1 bacterium]